MSLTTPCLAYEANTERVYKITEQMKRFNRYKGIRILFAGLMWLLVVNTGTAAVANYDVRLSWFIDMAQFDVSAHNNLFCIDCHQAIDQQRQHPNPENVTKDASAFFNNGTCAGSDCHDSTLKDYEKGVHGRIRFENREKYGNCIECHDPHALKSAKIDPVQAAVKKGRALCQPENIKQADTPVACKKDQECLECHRQTAAGGSGVAQKEAELCFHCHDQNSRFPKTPEFSHMPTFDVGAYHKTEHADTRCTECHIKSASYGHENIVQDCRQCHPPHDEKPVHDAHSSVDCKACHLQGVVEADQNRGLISWQPAGPSQNPVAVHQLVDTKQEVNCVRCHTEDNISGAAAMVLPAKSIICMTCHTATFSATDPVTLVTLIAATLVFLGLLSVWMSAGGASENLQGSVSRIARVTWATLVIIFSRRILFVLKAVLLDAIIQRRLFIQSKWRWFSHGLIFYPFLLRFGWGMSTLLISLFFPEWKLTDALLDKNNPQVAFLFDLTGVLIIVGVILTVFRKVITKKSKWPGLPKQEWLSIALIGGIIIVGFMLEGMRIAMTVDSASKQFAFFGYGISLLFSNIKGLTNIYGYVWYLHAVLTGAFIIWLPFSRMFHIVMGPVTVAINAAQDHNRHEGSF